MSKIYVDQTSLRIILTTGVVIPHEAITKEIRYRKPDGTTGSLTATVQDPVEGVLYYDLAPGSTLLDQEGEWSFWSYVVFSDGRKARGETVVETIWNAEE